MVCTKVEMSIPTKDKAVPKYTTALHVYLSARPLAIGATINDVIFRVGWSVQTYKKTESCD